MKNQASNTLALLADKTQTSDDAELTKKLDNISEKLTALLQSMEYIKKETLTSHTAVVGAIVDAEAITAENAALVTHAKQLHAELIKSENIVADVRVENDMLQVRVCDRVRPTARHHPRFLRALSTCF